MLEQPCLSPCLALGSRDARQTEQPCSRSVGNTQWVTYSLLPHVTLLDISGECWESVESISRLRHQGRPGGMAEVVSPLRWVSVAFLETLPAHQDRHQSGAHCSLALKVTAVLATIVHTIAREERANCATGRPLPPSAAIRGPSLPPPTSRQGRVGIRGFGSDLRVVTRTHRG